MFRIYTQQPFLVIPFSLIGQVSKKIRIIHSGFWLLLAVPLWLTTEVIAPQIVQAYTARVDLLIERLPEESYENVLRRAEAAARATTQRSFDQDILVTEVSVIISAQNQGAIAPILSLEVSRPQWQQRPDPQLWTNYFKTSRFLLLFDKQITTTQPAATTTPAPNNVNPAEKSNNPAPNNGNPAEKPNNPPSNVQPQKP
ncbi:MAG: hypothetical protein NWQ43_09460 [Dolichospermum sp.]|uniref:hypothetical protein n=1 Tax=Anabaena sp. UHCC 0187 TaxID=2590018 RepID=UPI0020C3A153|nr:hypothetical protein [Anabaena sp. UHCC 0187]MDP5017511.1 hypothetical protein [Dolichospermum sp.]